MERRFLVKEKKDSKITTLILEDLSFLLMLGDTQKEYKHSIPKQKRISQPRINLTFRQIIRTDVLCKI